MGIEWEEFIPVAMAMVEDARTAKAAKAAGASGAPDEANARRLLLQDRTAPQLERAMKKMFLYADNDCSGYLDFQEFKNCISQMGLPISNGQLLQLMQFVDVNRDGKVSYDEFVPVAIELLVKVMTGKIQPKASASRAAPAPAPATSPSPSSVSWSAYSSLYASRSPDASVKLVPVTDDKTDIADLEGRVVSVQCRRIIRSRIKELFAILDKDMDGRLSMSELTEAFGPEFAQRLMITLDRNQDGYVSQYEMRRFFDEEATAAQAQGVPEFEYLEGVVSMLQSAPF